MWDYSCGCPRAPGFVWGLWGFFLLLFSQLGGPGMESANHGGGVGHGMGNLGQGWSWSWPRRGNSALDGGDAPSPSFIPAGHGVNMESSQQL